MTRKTKVFMWRYRLKRKNCILLFAELTATETKRFTKCSEVIYHDLLKTESRV